MIESKLKNALEKTGIRQIILYGPPGTGKTYSAKKLALEIIVEPKDVPKLVEESWDEFLDFLEKEYANEEIRTKTGNPFKVKVEKSERKVQVVNKAISVRLDDFKKVVEKCWSDFENCSVESGESYHWALAKLFKEKFLLKKIKFIKIVQFHPSYTYEDFVRGIEIKTEGGVPVYETKNKIFAQMCKEAQENPDRKFVLIVDEINRANLPAVLGELIYALEYRGEPVETPYEINGDRTLVVPENLYVIGTMNTADRSVGHIDYAIRRRFIFYPVLANKDVIENNKVKELYEKIIEEIFKEENMAPEFKDKVEEVKIGHTYFIGEPEKVAYKFVYQVIPLLVEYVKDGILKNEEVVEDAFKAYFGGEVSWKSLDPETVLQKLL